MTEVFSEYSKRVLGISIVFVFIMLCTIGLLLILAYVLELEIILPLLAIGGVICLIAVLTAVAAIFQRIGLADKSQAMGLPEGSIRAVIALSLIVLFAILSVFLYQGFSGTGEPNVIEELSDADRIQFIKAHATARDLESKLVEGSSPERYTISYRDATDSNRDDFAKQLMVLLGTLMTAITSFYLGAGTVTSVAAHVTNAINPLPTVTRICPSVHLISDKEQEFSLEIAGSNLDPIAQVKISRSGTEIVGTDVVARAARVTCKIAVGPATSRGLWDVTITDGALKSVLAPGALEIK